MRISKAPEVRRQEILETAMRLFTEKGYEETSMRDIAQACGVVAALRYRYLDSKQKLFQEAMEAYVEECCGLIRRTLGDDTLPLSQKLDRLYQTMSGEGDFRYRGFFHKAGNEDFHQQLSLRLCQRMAPLLREALDQEERRSSRRFRDPETLIAFVTYGQIPLLSASETPRQETLDRVRHYIDLLLEAEQQR